MKTKRVVLLVGGMGAEREVSLSTGKGFEQALIELGYPYEVIDAKEDLPLRLSQVKADVALLALHGKYAEDGIVQSLCEYLKIPYSGSGVFASSLCMDKLMTKQMLEHNGIKTAPYEVIDKTHPPFKTKFKAPLVVKPSREGSSVGVTIVKDDAKFLDAVEYAAKYDRYLLVEKFIPGVELTVPVFANRVLTPIEIVPKSEYYNYQNKYTAGRTDYYLPARLPEPVIENAKKIALKAFEICRLRTYARIDFRVTPEGEPFVLEINTLPGCTPTSLVPKSAKHDGINFNQFVETLIESASLDYAGVV